MVPIPFRLHRISNFKEKINLVKSKNNWLMWLIICVTIKKIVKHIFARLPQNITWILENLVCLFRPSVWFFTRQKRFSTRADYRSDNNEMKGIGLQPTFVHIQAKSGQVNLLRMRWVRWHCPPDTGFEIQTLEVWGWARYLSVTEAQHNTEFYEWMGRRNQTQAWKTGVLTTTLRSPPFIAPIIYLELCSCNVLFPCISFFNVHIRFFGSLVVCEHND